MEEEVEKMGGRLGGRRGRRIDRTARWCHRSRAGRERENSLVCFHPNSPLGRRPWDIHTTTTTTPNTSTHPLPCPLTPHPPILGESQRFALVFENTEWLSVSSHDLLPLLLMDGAVRCGHLWSHDQDFHSHMTPTQPLKKKKEEVDRLTLTESQLFYNRKSLLKTQSTVALRGQTSAALENTCRDVNMLQIQIIISESCDVDVIINQTISSVGTKSKVKKLWTTTVKWKIPIID